MEVEQGKSLHNMTAKEPETVLNMTNDSLHKSHSHRDFHRLHEKADEVSDLQTIPCTLSHLKMNLKDRSNLTKR